MVLKDICRIQGELSSGQIIEHGDITDSMKKFN